MDYQHRISNSQKLITLEMTLQSTIKDNFFSLVYCPSQTDVHLSIGYIYAPFISSNHNRAFSKLLIYINEIIKTNENTTINSSVNIICFHTYTHNA